MDGIFDRLTDLLRSMGTTSTAQSSADPDVRDAMAELDRFMNTDMGGASNASAAESEGRFSGRAGTGRYSFSGATAESFSVPESLRKDFANLDIPFAAPIEQARAAHRRLIIAYHPDKHARNPDKYRIATEITQRVNRSFQRIRHFYESGKTPE